MRTLSQDDLAKNNGENGEPAFVAYKGRIYDVTKSLLWADGDHQGLHQAGKDLTADLESMAPHGSEVLERIPEIGTLDLG